MNDFRTSGNGKRLSGEIVFVFLSAVAFEIDVDFSCALCFRLNICVQHLAAELIHFVSSVETGDDFSCVRLLEEFARIKNKRSVFSGDLECTDQLFGFGPDADADVLCGSAPDAESVVACFGLCDVQRINGRCKESERK